MTRRIVWVSAGAASAVAARLAIRDDPGATLAYCWTGGEHPDNERFLSDLSRWLNTKIERLSSDEFDDVWDVWEQTRWLAGIDGARCTVEMKIKPRLIYQRPLDVHVFGYTADQRDVERAKRLRASYPEMTIETPLIERGINKAACIAMIERAGIAVPVLYGLGFPNNNCIPCVKATSPAYWALVRRHFPAQFDRMACLSRDLGVRLARIDNIRTYIDLIPRDYPVTKPIVPTCDFLCHLAETDAAETPTR